MRTYAAAVALALTALVAVGCAAIPVATISAAGAAAGAAAATADVTSAVYSMGKLRAAEMARFDDVRAAALVAANELSFTFVKETSIRDGRSKIVIEDDHGKRIVITIDQLTQTMSLLLIDVGILGRQQVARLFYKRTLAALIRLEAVPDDALIG